MVWKDCKGPGPTQHTIHHLHHPQDPLFIQSRARATFQLPSHLLVLGPLHPHHWPALRFHWRSPCSGHGRGSRGNGIVVVTHMDSRSQTEVTINRISGLLPLSVSKFSAHTATHGKRTVGVSPHHLGQEGGCGHGNFDGDQFRVGATVALDSGVSFVGPIELPETIGVALVAMRTGGGRAPGT